MGPIEITGLDGPMTIASASAIADSTSGVGVASAIPSTSTPSTGAAACSATRYCWRSRHPAAVLTRVCTRSSLIGRTAARTPSARAICAWASVRRPPSVDEHSPVQAGGEVAVGEAEPVGSAEADQAVEGGEGVALDAPAALLVDLAAQPVGDQVGIWGDVEADDLDVVGGVGDHREAGAEQVLHAGCQLGPAGASGEDHAALDHAQGSPSGRYVILMPAAAL